MNLSWSGTSDISSASGVNSDDEEIFVNSYSDTRKEVAEAMGISKDSVKAWFQNRRFKEKLRKRELEIDKKIFLRKAESSSCPSIIPTSTGCERSFPGTSLPRQICQSENDSKPNTKLDIVVKPNTATAPDPFRHNYYQNISAVREEIPATTSPYFSLSNTNKSYKNNDEYKASAEFSIDLFKKYKHILCRDKSESDIKSDKEYLQVQSSTSDGSENRNYQTKLEQHHNLNDMCMNNTNPDQYQMSITQNIRPGTSDTYPECDRIPQSSNKELMWSPLTLSLATPNIVPATNTSFTSTRTSSTLNENSVQKEDCDCCKCPKQIHHVNKLENLQYSEKPQYIYYQRDKVNPSSGASRTNDTSGINSDVEEIFENSYSDDEIQKLILSKGKCKRYRSAFTTDQINYLENIFKKLPYINQIQRHKIGVAIGLPDKCIKVWFQNRRMKEKVMNRDFKTNEVLYHKKAWSASCPSINAKVKGCEESVPVLYTPRRMFQSNTFLKTDTVVKSNTPTATSSFRPTHHEDVSPKLVCNSSPNSSASNKDNAVYKASAELPVDLCKKYNNFSTQHKSDNDIKWDNKTIDSSRNTYNLQNQELQYIPEDLSMKTSTSKQYQASIQGNIKPDNSQSKYYNVPRHIEYHDNRASGSHDASNTNVDLKEKHDPMNKHKKSKYKRYRGPFTTDQLSLFETAFRIWPHVNDIRCHAMASATGLTENCIRDWFENRRLQEKGFKRKPEANEDLYHEKASGSCPPTISTGCERSLPVISPPGQISAPNIAPKVKTKVEMAVESNTPTTSSPFKHKNYQDISSVGDEMPARISTDHSVSNASDSYKDNAAHETSEEFSIDLCEQNHYYTI
ncbi:unnamed protein product [Diatraea saccharalis]|uniref:Homeobox domain-containing protein n=1 Tax=Diatraea saccharalis TaxID=40085 RepID=A0A9N9WE98_9NEOP|nr:unnamed protein product [Diatraea saccharalis]